jgi:CRP-like cAMP-binding protein
MRRIAEFQDSPLFAEIDGTKLESHLINCSRKTFRKRETVFHPGEHKQFIYFLARGRMRVFVIHPDGQEFTVTVLEQGDVFSGHTRTFGKALEECEVVFVPIQSFRSLVLEVPALSFRLAGVLGDSLKNTFNIIEKLAFKDVNERLRQFLIETAEQRGTQIAEGVSVDLGFNYQEIATLVGCSRQTVSAFFNGLQKQGIIQIDKKIVIIKDLAGVKLNI